MRSHKNLFFGVLLFVSVAPMALLGQFQAPTREELSMTSDPKAPGADAVYLYREEKDDDPHAFYTVYARIKVLTEKGKQLATVHITYPRNFVFYSSGTNSSSSSSSSESHWDAPDINHIGADSPEAADAWIKKIEVSAISGRTIHADGTIIPLTGSVKELLKEKESGLPGTEKEFTLPAVEVGSILEYSYQVRFDRFRLAPRWEIQQPYFVHKAHYYYTPADQFLTDRTMGGAGASNAALLDIYGQTLTDLRLTPVLPPGKTLGPDPSGIYRLDLTDIPAIPEELNAPPLASLIYQVDYYYTATLVEKDYWQKIMQLWNRDLARYIAPTPAIQEAVSAHVAATDTPLQKASKLYAFVQSMENNDLLGHPSRINEARGIPFGTADKVLKSSSGNSHELALLYLTLVKAAGLNARPERISDRERQIFAPNILMTDQLDSLVVGVTIDGKEIIVDPGEKMAPFQTLGWRHAGAGGVALDANGKIEIVVTPLADNKDNSSIQVGKLEISDSGEVSGKLKVGFGGQQALDLRQLGVRSGAEAVLAALNSYLAAKAPQGTTVEVDHIAGLDDPSRQLVAVVNVSGTLGTKTGDKLTLPRLFFDTKEANPFPASTTRTLPVDMHYAAQEQEQITYGFPEGYVLEAAPEDAKLAWENNAVYQLRSKVEPTQITSARILARGFTLLDAKDYTALHDFYQKVVAADQMHIVLKPAAK